MLYNSIVFFLASSSIITATENPVKRIYANLLVHDFPMAVQEAKVALQNDDHNEELWQAYIQALAKNGDEHEMMRAWKMYSEKFPNAASNHAVVESMAWGVLEKASKNANPMTRIYALLGAFFSQDAKGVEIIHRLLSDANSCVRGAAVLISSHLHDAKLCDDVWRIFLEEKVPKVRLEAIQAVGEMKIKKAKTQLISIIADPMSTAQEKAVAIVSIISMFDSADRQEIQALSTSNRAGLRLVACKVVSELDLIDCLDCIEPLLKDHSSEVRAAAIAAFGALHITNYQGKPVTELAAEMLNDNDSDVAITAAWVLTLNDPNQGQKAFNNWLKHHQQDIRLLAASALASCGKYSLPLAENAFKQSNDPYVRLNLALGLIGQQNSIEQACGELCNGLVHSDDRWTWEERGPFRMLVPSTLSRDASSLDSPDAENQRTRLDIINTLAIMKYSHAKDALVQCLQHRLWGVAGMAAALMLTEGDEPALDLVRTLLDNKNDNIKLQAALILAIWGRDEEVITFLHEAYHKGGRDQKERILEGIGRVGASSSIPFLVERLNEASNSLRILAASALLETLYH